MNILITGAARRVGAACARMLHQEGHNIFLHYRSSSSEALILCEELNAKRPDSAQVGCADLLDLSSLRRLAEKAQTAWGGVDALLNNASAFFPTDFSAVTEQQWDELLGSNLKAPFFLAQALHASLSERRGAIINIIDIHAERGLKGYPAYSIAKAGLAGMTRILARELAPQVRVNGVSPGAIIWPEQGLSESDKQEILSRIALGKAGRPEDIAKAVRFLIQDAEYVTGQIVAVDGGRTLFC